MWGRTLWAKLAWSEKEGKCYRHHRRFPVAHGEGHAGAWEKREDEGTWGRSCNGLTTNPYFPSPWNHQGQRKYRVGGDGLKLSTGKRVKRCSNFVCFSPSNSILLGNNWIHFPHVQSVLPMTVISKCSPYLCLDPWFFPSYFLPMLGWGTESESMAGWAFGQDQATTE